MYCRIHLQRSLKKYFKEDHIIMKSYWSMITGKITEDQMLNIWNLVIENSKKEDEMSEDYHYDSDIETTDELSDESNEEMSEEDSQYEELFYNADDYWEDDKETIINSTYEEMMEIAESTKVNKGVNCLKELVKHKTDGFLPNV